MHCDRKTILTIATLVTRIGELMVFAIIAISNTGIEHFRTENRKREVGHDQVPVGGLNEEHGENSTDSVAPRQIYFQIIPTNAVTH